MEVDIVLAVTYFAFLLGLGVIVANLLKKARIPDVFFLLLLGLVVGPTVFMNPAITQYMSIPFIDVSAMGAIPDFLRILALILVVFTGTFNLGFRAFKRFSNISIKLAFIGVIFNTIFLGFIAHLVFGMELVYALLLGAVISGTGTGVLFAFEDNLKNFKKVTTLLKVESIFNSPLSILLPIIFLGLVALEPGALIEPMRYLSDFWLMIGMGVGTGVIVGLGVSRVLKSMVKEYTVLLLFSIALITYALAENVGGSGMLAVAICGLFAGDIVFPEKREVQKFDDHLSEMLRISVFTLLGAQIAFFMTFHEFIMALLFFFIVFISRPLFVIPLLGRKRKDMGKKDILLLSFVQPRGIASAAMAPIVAAAIISTPIGNNLVANQLVNIIFLIVLLSVLASTIVVAVTKSDGPPRRTESAKTEEDQLVEVKSTPGQETARLSFRERWRAYRKKRKTGL